MLKLNVGFSRKAGEANYGSRGASVHLELELDSGLVGDPERLKDRIRQLFVLAKASVNEELATQAGTAGNGQAAHGDGNGRLRDGTRKATAPQVRAIHAITQKQHLDPVNLVQSRYGVSEPEALSITEASELIDSLKAAGNDTGGQHDYDY